MQVGRRFRRREIQEHALEYLIGLLRPLERKNDWQLAEASEHLTPYNMQYFLARAHWDADAVRDDLTDYVSEELGEPDGVLVVDETGFIKKGRHSVGVQRQYKRHGRARRELPDRRIHGLRQQAWPGADGPGTVPAQSMD